MGRFLAHGGVERNVTLFKVEKKGNEEKIFIGYYRPLVDSITEQLKVPSTQKPS